MNFSPVHRLEPEQCERLIRAADSLPPTAHVVRRLNVLMRRLCFSMEDVAHVLGADPVLSARVVRVANGAFSGSKPQVQSLPEALQRVGLRDVFAMVGTAALHSFAPAELRAYRISGRTFLRAALFSAAASQLIAQETGLDGQTAYLAGLMRPLGVLVFERFAAGAVGAYDGRESLTTWERAWFGCGHAEASALVLDHWAFAESVTRSVGAFHGEELDDPLVAVLHAAGALAMACQATLHASEHPPERGARAFAQLGLAPSAQPRLRDKALQVARELETA